MNNQEMQFGGNPNFPGMNPQWNWNQNQAIRNLENRVMRLERETRQLNNRISRLERNFPTPFRETDSYQSDSYNMM